jgi:hypothetical protein
MVAGYLLSWHDHEVRPKDSNCEAINTRCDTKLEPGSSIGEVIPTVSPDTKIEDFPQHIHVDNLSFRLPCQMSSLARVRLARRLVCFPLLCSSRNITPQNTCSRSLFFQPATLRPQIRSVQTSADTTQLYEKPEDLSQPLTVRLHEDSFRSYLCDTPGLEVQVTKAELLSMYKDMQSVRRMEMAADALYKAKLIRGFCHLAIGQVRPFCSYCARARGFLMSLLLSLVYRRLCRLVSSVASPRTTAS